MLELIIIAIIVALVVYMMKSKQKDEERGIPEEKAKLIRRNFLIAIVIGLILIGIGISMLDWASNNSDALWGTRRYKETEDTNQWGTICLVAGIGLSVFSVIYVNNAKAHALGDGEDIISKITAKVSNSDGKTKDDSSEKLKQLKELLDDKVITKEEFEKKKKEILDKM